MKCVEASKHISDFVSGELGPGERSALEEHLDSCESCRSCSDDMMALRSRFHSLLRVSAPPGLRDRIAGIARKEQPGN